MCLRPGLFAFVALGITVARPADASAILEQYDFRGQTGTETSLAPSFVAAGIAGVSYGETGLNPISGADSINASGFTRAGAFYSFGLNVRSGYTASIDQLTLSTRSSATGPGFMNILASVNGGAFFSVASFIQSGTNFNDEVLNFSPLTGITSGVNFEIVAANQVSASGGAIGSTGTFRVGDYDPNGVVTPFTVGGTVSPAGVPVAEPSTLAVLSAALIGLFWMRRRRRTR